MMKNPWRSLVTAGVGRRNLRILSVPHLSPPEATTGTVCHDLIDVAQTDLETVNIGGNSPVQIGASLESKLKTADVKANQGKFTDALRALTQFRDEVSRGNRRSRFRTAI